MFKLQYEDNEREVVHERKRPPRAPRISRRNRNSNVQCITQGKKNPVGVQARIDHSNDEQVHIKEIMPQLAKNLIKNHQYEIHEYNVMGFLVFPSQKLMVYLQLETINII